MIFGLIFGINFHAGGRKNEFSLHCLVSCTTKLRLNVVALTVQDYHAFTLTQEFVSIKNP
jgi:hypothetical protein